MGWPPQTRRPNMGKIEDTVQEPPLIDHHWNTIGGSFLRWFDVEKENRWVRPRPGLWSRNMPPWTSEWEVFFITRSKTPCLVSYWGKGCDLAHIRYERANHGAEHNQCALCLASQLTGPKTWNKDWWEDRPSSSQTSYKYRDTCHVYYI